MGAGNDADWVELQAAQGADDIEKAVRVRRGSRPGEALLMDGQAAGEGGCESQADGHGRRERERASSVRPPGSCRQVRKPPGRGEGDRSPRSCDSLSRTTGTGQAEAEEVES